LPLTSQLSNQAAATEVLTAGSED